MTVIDLTAPARPSVLAREPVGVVRGFRPDIEGLRAVAVVLVVLFHVGFGFVPGGFVGVDVFFVVSGFLITSLLLAELDSRGRISFVGFYARRAKRLLPLSALVTAATLVGAWLVASPLTTRDLAADAVWASLFAMNVRLAVEGVDYGAAESSSAFQHFWSLAIEEQFYLVWPVLVLAASGVWWSRRRSGGGRPGVSRVGLNLVVS
ncbi:MAG: acyltransferase, partial [Micrococcales bacterium]